MKPVFVALMVAALAGCATNGAIVPSLEGKPRVKINQQAPVPTAPAPVSFETKGGY